MYGTEGANMHFQGPRVVRSFPGRFRMLCQCRSFSSGAKEVGKTEES